LSVVLLSLFVIAIVHCNSVSPDADVGQKVLVILDTLDVKRTHSNFFRDLAGQGFNLTFVASTDKNMALKSYGEYLFDHLILFAPSAKELGGAIDLAAILEFIDSGRNVIFAGDSNTGKLTRDLAGQNQIVSDTATKSVIDHMNFFASDNNLDHTLVYCSNFIPDFLKSSANEKPAQLLYRGAAIVPSTSRLVVPLIHGHGSAYSSVPGAVVTPADNVVAGHNVHMLVALHARNGARVLASGSLELFADELLALAPVPEAARARVLRPVLWAMQQFGRLRATNINHHLIDDAGNEIAPRGHYHVGQTVRYEVTLQEWRGGKWVPFVADDVQVEFSMLDPHVRQFLTHVKNGVYELIFKLPDVYGVFTFRTIYERVGKTPLTTISRVSVRPLRHDEYERFIVSAYPYYTSAFSMLVGLFLFSLWFLYTPDDDTHAKKAAGAGSGSSSSSTSSASSAAGAASTSPVPKTDAKAKKHN